MSIPVYDWVKFHAGSAPQKLAAVDVESNRRYTYAQLDERVTRLANALAAHHGIGKGDRVAVLAPNSTDQIEIQFARPPIVPPVSPPPFQCSEPLRDAVRARRLHRKPHIHR